LQILGADISAVCGPIWMISIPKWRWERRQIREG